MKIQEKYKDMLTGVQARQDQLIEGWKEYITSVDAGYKEKYGRSLDVNEQRVIAQCLENAVMDGALRGRSRLFEATTSDNIEFLGVQLPVIAALLPSLALNRISVVQALDRRVGAVFFLDVQAGQNKGAVAVNENLIDAKTGHMKGSSAQMYASDRVLDEVIGAAGGTVYAAVPLAYKPLRAGSVVVTDGVETFTDNGANVLVSDASGGTNGSVDYINGVISVTFAATTVTAPVASYAYKYEVATKGVPEINLDFRSESITAQDFPLKAHFKLGAAIDAEKAHGIKLENELVKYLAGEIRFAMDHHGINLINEAATSVDAAAPIGGWTATPGSGNQWIFKKYEFLDLIEKGNNAIIAKTLRGMATFILAGNNVARVIKQLGDHFKPAADLGKKVMTGPTFIGTLDGRDVIQDPFMDINTYTLGFKGDGYLFAGALFAPYIPLFSTPTLTTADLEAQKGFLSAAGYKIVNKGMFTYGTISGLL